VLDSVKNRMAVKAKSRVIKAEVERKLEED